MRQPVSVFPAIAYFVNYDPHGTLFYLAEFSVLGFAARDSQWTSYKVQFNRYLFTSEENLSPLGFTTLVDSSLMWSLAEAYQVLKTTHADFQRSYFYALKETASKLQDLSSELEHITENLKEVTKQEIPTLEALMEKSKPDILKVAALLIRDKQLLVARNYNRDVFYAVGGKLEEGESELECLGREVEEEINCKVVNAKFYKRFSGLNVDFTKTLEMPCYFVEIEGEPTASNEIAELKWLSAESYNSGEKEKLANMLSAQIVPSLIKDGLL